MTIRRHKDDEEMTVEDWVRYRQSGERPERPEYREARAKALRDAGLEPDHEELTPEDPEFHNRRRNG